MNYLSGIRRISINVNLFFVFLLFICLSVLPVMAQQDKNITLDVKNETVENVLEILAQQTGLKFFYDQNLVSSSPRVSMHVKNATLQSVLNEISLQTQLNFNRDNNTITVGKKQVTNISQIMATSNVLTVKGRVVDVSGEAVIGANVLVKGMTNGVITDVDGKYTLNDVPADAVVLISYVGYQSREFRANDKELLNVVLKEDSELLNEVVVVGYGVQKKVNLVGSVASVDSKQLQSRPINNVASGLQGSLPGVTIINSTSRPGDSNTTMRIRGVGTLNNSDPLILIDGVEGNLQILNPNDIESVSVLKDAASSAIYGSRAANGVVLVTTKEAMKDVKPTITYSGYYVIQTPTTLPEMCNSVEYLTLLKEATANVKKTWGYTEEDINTVINGTDPDNFANVDWIDELYRKTAPQHGHNVTLNGGNQNLGYYLSYGNLTTSGLFVGDAYHSARNNFRAKIVTEVIDRVKIDANIGYTDVDNWTPSVSDSSSDGLFMKALKSSPLVPVRFSDGKWGYGGSTGNPIAIIYDGGFINYKSRETSLNFGAEVDIINGLTAKVRYAARMVDVLRKAQRNKVDHFYPGTDIPFGSSSNTSSLSQRDGREHYQNIMAQADYDKSLGDHNIHVLAGFSQEWNETQTMNASREDLISDDLHVLNAGTINMKNDGTANHWAIRSGFWRINYNYNERYLFEANLRYDLSSRFHPDHRGGWFPSFSGAWRITEEPFMQITRKWLDNLKLRISYGTLGNQYTSLYPYLSTIKPVSSVMPIGGILTTAMKQNTASNSEVSWETVKMANWGLDVAMFNNRFNITFDYFIKDTDDILLQVKLPGVLGVSEPYQNAGKVRNKGWELNLAWNDKIGNGFTYGVDFNLSDVKNEVVSMGNTADDFSGNRIRAVGYPIDSFWGFEADGLYSVDDFNYDPQTDTYTPKETTPILQELKTKVQPGDIKYKDLNKDGKITSEDDRTYIGSAIPRYTYSLGFNAAWKGIDFKLFLQGVGKCDGYLGGIGRHAFTEVANYPQKEHLDRWTWENQNPNASYPRFTYEETYNRKFSSFWIEDASYLRVKNIQVGYTFPSSCQILNKLRINNLRLYFSGENLWTLTDYFSSYDPETPVSDGGFYPITASYSFGISITLK